MLFVLEYVFETLLNIATFNCFRQFKIDIGLADQSIEERNSDMRKAIASQDMRKAIALQDMRKAIASQDMRKAIASQDMSNQKAQSKLEMAICARKRESEKLETLMKKKK